MKTCRLCSIEKPYDSFYRNNRLSDGYTNECRECKKELQKQWRKNNPLSCKIQSRAGDVRRKQRMINDPEYAKEYRRKANERMKRLWRESPEHRKRCREWVKAYINRRYASDESYREKIKGQSRKMIGEITDAYVISLLVGKTGADRSLPTPELIEQRRLIVKLKRKIKHENQKQH